MSIKQNGGVFGRNPTFNDVTIEGQLTFDGDIDINSDLKIDGDLDVIGGMTVDTNVLVVDKTNNRVGIGTDTIYSDLQVHKATGVKLWITANGGNPSDAGSLRFAEQKDGFNYFEFLHNGSTNELKLTSTNNDIMTFNRGTQNVSISNGNLVMATSGKGIDFSATAGTGTSELFDDYEEGTFTVTTNGDASGAFSAETGEYTKIGNVVYIKITFRVSANFASNKIGGLPFTPSYDAGASGKTMVGTLLTSSSSSAPIAGGAVNGSNYIEFFASNSTASAFAPNTANDYHRLQGFYYTA